MINEDRKSVIELLWQLSVPWQDEFLLLMTATDEV